MKAGTSGRLARWVGRSIESFPTCYFALVMATGICSIAMHLLEMPAIARTLLGLNIIFFSVLGLMFVSRLVRWPRQVLADLCDHQRGPAFFTIVAAVNVVGIQSFLIAEIGMAIALWTASIGLWFIIMYTFFLATIVREQKPSLEQGINGAWLVAVVATQSVSVLGTFLASTFLGHSEVVLFFALCMFLLGALLYLSIITLIFYRFTFLTLTMEQLTPPYWINMGAVAISTLAGATLLLHAQAWPFLAQLRPFLLGSTLFFWAGCSWWIPLLILLGIWRHGVRRFPLNYDPQYWGMIFPLGMYAVATIRLAQATEIDFLWTIPKAFVWLALGAWVLTFAAMVRQMIGSWRAAP